MKALKTRQLMIGQYPISVLKKKGQRPHAEVVARTDWAMKSLRLYSKEYAARNPITRGGMGVGRNPLNTCVPPAPKSS